MKLIVVAFLAVLLLAFPGYSQSSEPQHKIVFLSRTSSECLLGDECPDPRRELDRFGQKKDMPQVLPSLLSLGWRVVSITPAKNEEGWADNSVAVSSAYVLLAKP